MHLGLKGKVVLLTGGTKGIGRTMVKAFLEEGATVHFCSRTKDNVDSAAKQLSEEFPDSIAIGTTVDVSDQEQLAQWVKSSAEQSGAIDVVVANVSALASQDDAKTWKLAFETDMLALHTLVQTALPYLEKSKGNIVSISSVSGRILDFTAPGPYGSIKAAIIHYTASLAHNLAPKGIRANTCSPGNIYIEDGVWGGIEKNAPALFKSQMEANPMGRMGRPEEIANAVLFLASEKASFISGSNLVVDGALCQGVQF